MRPNLRVKRKLVVEPVGLRTEDLPSSLDGRTLFGNDHPLELEIGSGKGTFLTDQAKKRPDINFLGLEHARKYWMYAADRLRRNECLNTRLILGDAAVVVSELVADGCLSAIHIYFPDPWPKKRHHKRRLVQEPFLNQVERTLCPGGRLQIVTDHRDYSEQIERVVRGSKLDQTDYRTPGSAAEGEIAGTNFERKYRREGRPFYAIAAVKS
jgi:tRNA (guanine-N7-)-methyltransferase